MRLTFDISRMFLFLLCCIMCGHYSQPVELQRCQNNSIPIFENGRTRINCTGLHPSQNIYWTISYDNGTEQTLAKCGGCKQDNSSQSSCPECEVTHGDYSVTRVMNFTIIRLVKGDDRDKNGATLKCSEMNYTNDARATCKIRVKTYKLPQCQDGKLPVSDASPWTSIRCEDSDPGHRVNWTITDTKGNTTTIAICGKGSEDYNCTVYDADFNVTRNDGLVSELKIMKRVREKVNFTLACVRRDGAAAVTCRLRMAYNTTQRSHTPLLPVVGGGVAAALLVVVLVVVIVIFVLKRRGTRSSIPETATVSDYGYLTPVSSSPSQPEETGGVYQIIHESDMRRSGLYAIAAQPGNMPDIFNVPGARHSNPIYG